MVARGPGAVGCAHCTMLGAGLACPVCKHLVCAGCAANWATCTEPSGRTFRLGMGSRLIDVDPAGRLGLVTKWNGVLRAVDLRRLAWIHDDHLPRRGFKELVPRLTADGCVLAPELGTATNEAVPMYFGLGMTRIGGDNKITLRRVPLPVRSSGVSLDGRYYCVTDTECVAIVTIDGVTASAEVFEPLPKKVVQAAFVDPERGLIVAATWGEVIVHQIVDGRLHIVAHVETTGDALWVALANDILAVHVKGGAHRGVTAWRLRPELTNPTEVLHVAEGVQSAALSHDGRYLAAGIAGEYVLVRALADAESTILEGHTDTISFLKFCGPDHVLVSADDDNRVILRPRGAAGYPQVVLGFELATS